MINKTFGIIITAVSGILIGLDIVLLPPNPLVPFLQAAFLPAVASFAGGLVLFYHKKPEREPAD